jgi:urate oxidase
MPTLTFDTYGKTRVRLLQVLRDKPSHEIADITATILFEGKLAESYATGDNSLVLPTDTIKNTVYVLARQHRIVSIEEFGLTLGSHFLHRLAHVSTVNVLIQQTPWDRIGSSATAFVQSGNEQRTADLRIERDRRVIVSGIRNLQVLKTAQSAFFGYLKDEYTTLPETSDRLLGTVLDARWTISPEPAARDFNELHAGIRGALLDSFSAHDSLSVQHTLYAMAETILEKFDAVQEIHMAMPNKHCLLVDLARFGIDNPNQIFVPTDEPSGFIEARLTR